MIEKVKPGLYKIWESVDDSHVNPGFIDLCKGNSRIIICLISAVEYHGLSTVNPSQIYAALPRDEKAPKITYPLVKFYRWKGNMYETGIEKIKTKSGIVKIYKSDTSYNVRTHALYALAATDSDEFKEILSLSIKDPYEFIRRKSAELMGEIGSDKYVSEIIHTMIYDQSKRVSYNIGNALLFVNQDKMIQEAEKVVAELPNFVDKEGLLNIFNKTADKSRKWLNEDIIPTIMDDTLSLTKRINSVRTLRNYNFNDAVPKLLTILEEENIPVKLKTVIVEAMGWYNYSEERANIIATLGSIIEDETTAIPLLNEAVKTRSRLISGCNVPITP